MGSSSNLAQRRGKLEEFLGVRCGRTSGLGRHGGAFTLPSTSRSIHPSDRLHWKRWVMEAFTGLFHVHKPTIAAACPRAGRLFVLSTKVPSRSCSTGHSYLKTRQFGRFPADPGFDKASGCRPPQAGTETCGACLHREKNVRHRNRRQTTLGPWAAGPQRDAGMPAIQGKGDKVQKCG